MNDDIKKNKLQRFLNDPEMVNAVYGVLLASFIKERPGQDVYVLAASRLAIDLLNVGWNELEKYKLEKESSPPTLKQVGL